MAVVLNCHRDFVVVVRIERSGNDGKSNLRDFDDSDGQESEGCWETEDVVTLRHPSWMQRIM